MKSLILVFSFFCSLIAQGEEPATGALSLGDATRQAEANNPDLKKLEATAEKKSWAKTEALSGYLPHLSAGYEHFFSSNYMRESIVFGGSAVSFPAAYPQDSLTIGASWTIFDGLESWHQYQAASLAAEAAELDVARARFHIEESVRSAFYRTLAAQKLVEVGRQNIKTLQEHLDKARITEKAGYGTRFDIIRIEATLEEARAELEQAEGRYQDSRGLLNEVMGVESDATFELKGELPVLSETDVPQSLSLASGERDDLQAQFKREKASREIASAAKGFWLPSVSLFAEEQYYKFGSFDAAVLPNDGYQNASMVGIRLKWNLFDGGASYAREREAAAAAVEMAAESHKALAKLPHDFATWKRGFYQNVALYRARARALLQYEESVRLAVVGVKTGSRTHTEMLDAELDLFRARAGLVRAQADALEALGQLELAVGHRVWKEK